MCVCVHVHVYMNECKYARVCMHAWAGVCVWLCLCLCLSLCLRARACVCVCVCLYVCKQACLCVCLSLSVCLSVVWARMYVTFMPEALWPDFPPSALAAVALEVVAASAQLFSSVRSEGGAGDVRGFACLTMVEHVSFDLFAPF